MKSELQTRAEDAALRFGKARRPIVIEFAGVPKAGKTSTIGSLYSFLKRCGFRVEIVVERASVCPIRDKKHFNFNVWTACTTLAQILEKTQNPPRPDDPHILILDRGLFDSVCWLTMMERLERIRSEDRKIIEQFLLVDDWRKRISGVIVMTVSASDSMKREQGLLPVEGGAGSIMNADVLQQMLDTTNATVERMRRFFRIFEINTSTFPKDGAKRTAEQVAKFVIDIVEEHLEEEILSVPRSFISQVFSGKRLLSAPETRSVIAEISNIGDFRPREQVENDATRVQVLPISVVRNRAGEILRLRRKEKDPKNPLHEKIVIWAGGHLRKEDDANGESIIKCIQRELQEELRLCVEPGELTLLGAIYSDLNLRSAKHLAIVFEWRAQTDEVAIALSTAEFFERRGTSLSGSFVTVEALAADIEAESVDEVWTTEIVREFLAKGKFKFSPQLFQ